MPSGTHASAHPFTLVFDDPELERAYIASRKPSPRTFTLGTLMLILAWLAAAGWARVVVPGDAEMASWRIAVVVVTFVATIPPVWLARSARVAKVSSSIGVILAAGVAMEIERRAHEPLTRYMHAAFCVFLMNTHLLAVGEFVFKQALSWVLVASWIVVAALTPGVSVVDAVFWVGTGQFIGTFVVFTTERQRRRIFVQRRIIEEERARSEQLLRNMLPEAIAERLKREPGVIAEGHDAVTVLFADIVGFTPLSEGLTPNELVDLLNQVFSRFDEMARLHGLEKIKTIGDAYMVVGGLPTARPDHAAAVAAMALEMRDAVYAIDARLSLRIGVHSGPAVAGVIGTSKYSYDLWGDTVNTASRMESHGASGEIHVTEAVRDALGDGFRLEARGEVEIKGKGPMRTWWLKHRMEPGAP